MANKKGLFGILNDGNGAGLGITLCDPDSTEGTDISATIASPAFVNDDGVLVFPALDALGRIPVVLTASNCYFDYGKVTGSTSFQAVAVIVGALLKKYGDFEFVAASMTECDWELVYIDNVGGTPVETILAAWDTGPGQYTVHVELSCVNVDTTTGTGIQNLVIRGKLLEATGSEISATLAMREAV